LLLPAARRAMKAHEDEQAAQLFRAAARDPLLPLRSKIRVSAAALSPRLARGLWSELVLRRNADGSFVDNRHRVYRMLPEALDGFHEATHSEGATLRLTGWATDAGHEKPADHIAVFDGPHFVAAGRVDRPRPDVARHFANARVAMCGFQIFIPRNQISGRENLRVFALSRRAAGPLPGLPQAED